MHQIDPFGANMTTTRDFTGPFLKNGRTLIIAYDQGLEHGPSADFDMRNVDPAFIVDIANKGGFTALALQKGTAEKYYDGKTPLILKLNGKSTLPKGEPISRQHCSVKYAEMLGAKAVGYTIFLGSGHESEMVQEWGRIQEEAHERGMAAILWVYPRGSAVASDTTPDIVAYAARAGLEFGADIVKIKYTGDAKTFAWAVKAGDRAHGDRDVSSFRLKEGALPFRKERKEREKIRAGAERRIQCDKLEDFHHRHRRDNQRAHRERGGHREDEDRKRLSRGHQGDQQMV